MIDGKEVLAIIAARGGSKSVPRKNIRLLDGKPLIAYTIDESLKSRYIDRVIVSTEDEEIARIARECGAEVPFMRPDEHARDESSSLSVLIHALEHIESKEGYVPDITVSLTPTSPFRKAEHIDKAIEKLEGFDAVAGVREVVEHPYFMMDKRGESLVPFLDIKDRPLRRQDVPKLYSLNASIYVTYSSYYKKASDPDPVAPLFDGKVAILEMDAISSLDINDLLDFLIAETIVRNSKDMPAGKV